jgi:hypothetical protein
MRFPEYAYENVRRVVLKYEEFGTAYFIPVCPICRRFVRVDKTICCKGEGRFVGPNATCSKCGRVAMPFEGWD